MAGSALLLIAAILLIVAAFVGWYATSISATESGGGQSISITGTITFYPGTTVKDTSSCSGSSFCSALSSSNTTSYSNLGLNKTGMWYALVEYLSIGGFVVGIIAAILGFMTRGKGGMMMGVVALAAIALILSIATPMLLLAVQPGALNSDSSGHGGMFGGTNGSGPWSSFFGSCSGSGCGVGGGLSGSSASWGPSLGWYLAIVAFVLFLIGLIVFMMGRGEDAPMMAGAPMAGAPAGGPSSSGPMMGSSPTGGTNVCPTCGMSFASADELSQHAKSAHGSS